MSKPVGSAEDGVRLTLHVQPGASRSELAGMHGDALKVRVAAPPVDGAANRELIRFLAAQLANSHYFNITRARTELGYDPAITMEEGMRRLQTWLESR